MSKLEKAYSVISETCIRRISFISLLKFKSCVLRDNGKTYKLKLFEVLSQRSVLHLWSKLFGNFEQIWIYLPEVWCDSLHYNTADSDGIFYLHLEILKVPVSSISYMSQTMSSFDVVTFTMNW